MTNACCVIYRRRKVWLIDLCFQSPYFAELHCDWCENIKKMVACGCFWSPTVALRSTIVVCTFQWVCGVCPGGVNA